MLAIVSEFILGSLLVFRTIMFEEILFKMFNLTCGFEVADMGCAFVSLILVFFGLFLISDGLINIYQFWRIGE